MTSTRRQFLGVATASTITGLAGCAGNGGDGDDGGDGGDVDGGTTPTETPTPSTATTVARRDHGNHGEILVDGDGRTLYMFDSDTQGELASTCTEGCAEAWPPLTTDGEPAVGSGVTASLETFERDDGSTQIAANGWPLYYFQNDSEPGDANGQGANDAWWVLGPDGTPKRPQSATVAVRDHTEHGAILVDGEGRTLYMWDNDEQGAMASACSDSCAEAWPPLTTGGTPDTGDAVTATLDTFEREDGTVQVAANGWPLYYFEDDSEAGDAAGHGVGNDWWVLGPDGSPKRPSRASLSVRSHPQYGEILVDGDGRTLYMFDRDERGAEESACTTSGCLSAWPPFTTDLSPTVGDVDAPVSTFERDDGGLQLTVDGWPLYYYSGDEEPGDANGQGSAGIWWVLASDGTPIREEPTTPTPGSSTPTPTDDDGVSY